MVIKYGVAALMCLLELRPYVNTVRGGKFPRSPFYAAIGTKWNMKTSMYHIELTANQIEHNNGDIYLVPIYIHRQTISMYPIKSQMPRSG